MICFDTNILVYAADRHGGERHGASIRLLAAATWTDAALSEQCIMEFFHVAMRKQNHSLADAAALVNSWLANFALLTAQESIVPDTVSLLGAYPLSVWDAHMLAVCAASGCKALFSEDLADRQQYGPVQVVNPFNPNNVDVVEELLSR